MDILKVILTALLSAGALFLIAKIMGHKQMAQLDFFDYINGITIGSIAAELATELESPLKPLTAMIVYGTISVTLSLVTRKFPGTRKFINGTPTVIMNGGKIYRENMKKAKLDLSEFMVMCRQEGYFDLTAVQTAIFEYNGRLTILPVSEKRPVEPEDMNLSVVPSCVYTEVILDGRILGENLVRMGVDENWLEKRIKEQGYKRAEEIYLGICDDNKNLVLFKGE